MSEIGVRRELALAVTVLLLTTTVGLALTLQGWRSRIPDEEEIVSISEARALIAQGDIPARGGLTDYGSYFPPGTAWLIVPGILASSDPRLVEVAGSATLYLGSLIGIFLVARRHCGLRGAVLAVVLYGVSESPLLLAGSLWPRGHPFFYIWIVYFADRWLARRDARYLGAALLTWATGMYVHMELAPALFILPALWWFRRPPIRWQPLALAIAVALVVWYPYLRFEWTRSFEDVKSQVLLRHVQIVGEPYSWCDPATRVLKTSLPIESLGPDASSPSHTAHSLFSATAGRSLAILDLLFCNFVTQVPAGEFALLALVGGGLLVAGLGRRHGAIQIAGATGRSDWRRPAGVVGLFALTVVAGAIVERRFAHESTLIEALTLNARRFQALVVLLGFAWLARSARIRGLAVQLRAAWPANADARVLAIALVVPWSILLFLTEPDRTERMFGIWPLQVILTAGFISAVHTSAWSRRMVRWAIPAVAAVVIVLNSFVLERTGSWVRTGWAGSDSALFQLADRLGGLLRSAGRTHAAIGYVLPGEPATGPVRSRSTPVQLEYLLAYRHGISNTDRCAEGIAAGDEYRIAETGSLAEGRTASVEPSDSNRFYLLKQFDDYALYRRD